MALKTPEFPKFKVTPEWKDYISEKTQFTISNIIRVSILVAAIGLFIEGQYLMGAGSVATLLLTFLPAVLQRNYRLSIPIEFELFVVLFIYSTLFLGDIKSFYLQYWWWDLFLHTFSGILLGTIGFTLVYILNSDPKVHVRMKPIFIALFALSFALAIGTIWEIFEFAMDQIFGLNMQRSGLVDTMWDLIVDFLGALFVSIIGFTFLKLKKAYFMQRIINKFIETNPHIFKFVKPKGEMGRTRKLYHKVKKKIIKKNKK